MSVTTNPGPIVLLTLRDLSLALNRATALNPSKDFTRVIPNPSKGYVLGGLGIATAGKSLPSPVRYGAITLTPRPQVAHIGQSSGVNQALGRAYDHPGVRFGDRSKGSARPLSADGAQTFHFSHSYISKTSPILELIKAARGGRRYSNSKATEHLLYIERDGAAEKIGKDKEFLEFDLDTEGDEFEKLARAAAGRSAGGQQDYLERPGAVERTPVHNLSDDELDKLEYASFGNIGDTLEERRHFWNALERFEQEPQGDQVSIKFVDHPEWWELAVQNLQAAPTHLRSELERQAAAGEPADFRKKLPTQAALAIHEWAVALDHEAPITITPGRGGRIQNRIIAELPWELDGRERLEIVRNFTNKLAEKGLPFWAVIHAPDDNNDKRNFHVHIVYSDRPAARMKDPDKPNGPELWDFEIRKEKVYKNYTRRVVHPYAQNKLPEVSVGKESDAWVPILREHWEKVSNAVMERVGIAKRYDARSYEAMGIQFDPLKHIPSKTFNKERKGELTEDGVALARRQWQIMQDRLVAAHQKRAARRQRLLDDMAKKAKAVLAEKSPYKDIALTEADRLIKLMNRVGARLTYDELHQDLGRLIVDRIASRPKLIIDEDRRKAEKSPGRTKLKGGQGHGQTTRAPEDKGGATQPVGPAAREAMTFLLEVFGRAVYLDGQSRTQVDQTQSQLNNILKRLDHLIAHPTRHPLDRRDPGFIDWSIVDPAPEVIAERKQEKMDRVIAGIQSYVEAALPRIQSQFDAPSPAPAPGPVSAPAPINKDNAPQGPAPLRATSAPVRNDPAKSSSTRSAAPAPTLAPAPAPSVLRDPVQKPADVGAAQSPALGSPPPAAPARPLDRTERPRKARFRPEPFYKPAEKERPPAAAQARNPGATPINSPAAAPVAAPVNSAVKPPAPNNSKPADGIKAGEPGNSRSASGVISNNSPGQGNSAPVNIPVRDNSAAAAATPGSRAPAPQTGINPKGPAAPAALSSTRPAPVTAPSSAPAAKPQVQLTPEPKAQPGAASEPKKEPAPVRTAPAPTPQPVPAQPGRPAGKDDARPASATKPAVTPAPVAPLRPTLNPAPVAPQRPAAPAPAPTRVLEPSAARPQPQGTIVVGKPLNPAPKPIEPIVIDARKLPKKKKGRGKGRDDGPEI
ncbi:MobA/MobL family protein [Microvirga massiliensis]|uniref:MobA/MobL family protein n=1 Tax=Microvirga massiliensis TaxID=1033741 RepID=UPI00062BC96A|nr:MobA/MobL family protein [Microvirga massiliensis]